jgi:hypothetical protein
VKIGIIKDEKYYRLQDSGEYVADDGSVLGEEQNKSLKGIAAIRPDKPFVSRAAAVHVDQVDRFNQELANEKVSGAYYRKEDGNLVCESRSARNKVLKLRNMRDGDAGYSDWAGH